ncbi:MAG TPA: tetratricopeptide repeat protein [Myxococcaceae bacterium]|nr:tetratricopeptide repeat protein [Myxococcaceae bacterium]
MRTAPGTWRWLVVVVSAVTACAHAPGPPRENGTGEANSTDGLQVVLEREAGGSEATRVAWTAYGLGRAKGWTDRKGATKNDSGDDYLVELEGRRAALVVWKDVSHGERDADLDLLVEAEAKGFLEELVVLAFARPGWTVPPDALQKLDLEAFWPWALENLQGREVKTGAATIPMNGKRWPDVPGADLPDPAKLMAPGEQMPCSSWRVLEEGVQRWRVEAGAIDGLPIAATNAQNFLKTLGAVRDDPEFRRRGATWVAPRVGTLHLTAGFCANDREDWAAGQRALEVAIVLLPTDNTARVELAHSFIKLGRPDRALAHLEAARKMTTNPCELARVWRKIGYARFDQHQYAQSKEAYETSLAYEPGNQLALGELKLLSQALSGSGGNGSGSAHSIQVTTSCVESQAK